MAELEEAGSVVAESVSVAEEKVAEPEVRLPEFRKEGEKNRRVGDIMQEEKEIREVREFIAPRDPRAICRGLLRRVGKQSVFKDADPRLVARGGSTLAAVGVSQGADAWRESPGASRAYQLRLRRGGFGYMGSAGY